MVSLWPFKGDDTSTAAFEKTLSQLSTKIGKVNSANASLKQRSRRFRALWTLYGSFAYILYTLILTLVTGWRSWSAVEYTAVLGGPPIIYLVRSAISTYYDYRIARKQSYLDDLQSQKSTAVEKFKAATKYDSTHQLLEKYGADDQSPGKATRSGDARKKGRPGDDEPRAPSTPQRTMMPPPPTANIQRPLKPKGDNDSDSSLVQGPVASPLSSDTQRFETSPKARNSDLVNSQESFAPNAEPSSPQFMDSHSDRGRWYDRIMDVLLGDDENKAINRIALICTKCRLVNGQAPPGIQSDKELGRWRCFNCQAWNGQMNEVQEALSASREPDSGQSEDTGTSTGAQAASERPQARRAKDDENT